MTDGQTPEPISKNWLYGGIVGIAVLVAVLVAVSFAGGDDENGQGSSTTSTDTTFTGTTSTDGIRTDTTSTDGETTDTGDSTITTTMYDGFPSSGFTIGRRDADITIIEVLEPQCPHCAAASRTLLPQLVERYLQSGRATFEMVPLSFISPTTDSDAANRALFAAGEQGRAWAYAHVLFERQGREGTSWVDDELLEDIAFDIGLNPTRFARDRTTTAARGALVRAQARARRLSVRGTPTFIVRYNPTGREVLVEGLNTADFERAIEVAQGGPGTTP